MSKFKVGSMVRVNRHINYEENRRYNMTYDIERYREETDYMIGKVYPIAYIAHSGIIRIGRANEAPSKDNSSWFTEDCLTRVEDDEPSMTIKDGDIVRVNRVPNDDEVKMHALICNDRTDKHDMVGKEYEVFDAYISSGTLMCVINSWNFPASCLTLVNTPKEIEPLNKHEDDILNDIVDKTLEEFTSSTHKSLANLPEAFNNSCEDAIKDYAITLQERLMEALKAKTLKINPKIVLTLEKG